MTHNILLFKHLNDVLPELIRAGFPPPRERQVMAGLSPATLKKSLTKSKRVKEKKPNKE